MTQKTKDRNQLFGLVARTALPPLLLCALPFRSRTASQGPDLISNRKTQVVDLQQKPNAPNPSGHTMIDGPTESSDRSSTAANKTLVRAFVEDIFIERDVTKLDRYFDGNNYINHNPRIADGVDHLRDRLLSSTRTPFRFDTEHMVLGEGDFVLVVTEGTFGDRNTSFYDLFRVQSCKIAEHWDVVEEVPAKSESKNTNGKF
jgi:predicted SnoaL-like aldol condensation-catalyzing enzyme